MAVHELQAKGLGMRRIARDVGLGVEQCSAWWLIPLKPRNRGCLRLSGDRDRL
jgi:hypothetical protein